MGLVDPTLGFGPLILGLTSLDLRLGLTLTRFLGLGLPVAPSGGLVLGFLTALFPLDFPLLFGTAGLLGLLLTFLGARVLALVPLSRRFLFVLLLLGLLSLGILLPGLRVLSLFVLSLLAFSLLAFSLLLLGLLLGVLTRGVLGSLLFIGGFGGFRLVLRLVFLGLPAGIGGLLLVPLLALGLLLAGFLALAGFLGLGLGATRFFLFGGLTLTAGLLLFLAFAALAVLAGLTRG